MKDYKDMTKSELMTVAVDHWSDNAILQAYGKDMKAFSRDCCLCQVFNDECCDKDGEMCPIYDFTSHKDCGCTPWHGDETYAQSMVQFLIAAKNETERVQSMETRPTQHTQEDNVVVFG